MRDVDRVHFREAAKPEVIHKEGLWILVRRTNSDSLKYIGRASHRPKGRDCKAKTATSNFGGYQHAGLVVDPILCPRAFAPERRNRAVEEWNDFIAAHPLSPWRTANGRSLPPSHQPTCCVNTDAADRDHYGCLVYRNSYLHGDYDLYDIILPDQPTRNLALVGPDPDDPWTRGKYLTAVANFVNRRIKVDMVLHGAQAQGFGHDDGGPIDVFGPDSEETIATGDVTIWYELNFPGRQAIDIT